MNKLLMSLVLCLGVAGSAHAMQGDAEAGAGKVAMCAACHGADGNSALPNFPKLAGLGEKYLYKQLLDVQEGRRVIVEMTGMLDSFDAADDWIAEAADARSIVITADILLADRALKAGATVLAHNGKPFTMASIGPAIATRAIMADLRAGMDGRTGGPPPFSKADRSQFLQALDAALVRLKRG